MIRTVSPRDLASRPAPADWPALAPDEVTWQGADLSLLLPGEAVLRARCSLWWTQVPPLPGERIGVIGHFGAADAQGARLVLDAACEVLARQGCSLAVGPMDGNTWRRHRLVVESSGEPPFFLEPTNPATWPAWWEAAAFAPLAHYFSAAGDLSADDPRATDVAARLEANGVRIRPVSADDFDAELRRIHDVACVSFRDNYLYTPLSFEPFAAQYRAVRPLLVPALALVAEQGARPVGFSFSIPDPSTGSGQAPRATERTVIIKTVAILPERALLGGLGTLLVQRTREAARALGFTREVHALMHETNQSRNISARTARPIRRYALYARRLTSA